MASKKFGIIAASFFSLFFFSSTVFAGSTDVSVKINGDKIHFDDQKAAIVDGRTLVPLRGVFDSMGFAVDWNDNSRTAQISNGLKDIFMTENIKRITANSKTIDIDVAPQIVNNRMMIPLRAVAESIDADVEWEESTRTVLIYYDKADGVHESINNVGMDEQQYLKTLISIMEELRTAAEHLEDAVLCNVVYLGDFYKNPNPKVTDEQYELLNEPLKKLLELKAPESLFEADECVKSYVNFIRELITFSKQSNPKNTYDKNNSDFMSEIDDYKLRIEELNSRFGNNLLEYFLENKIYWEGIYGENVIDLLLQ